MNKNIWWVTQSNQGKMPFIVRPNDGEAEEVDETSLNNYDKNVYFFSKEEAELFAGKLNRYVHKKYKRPSLAEVKRESFCHKCIKCMLYIISRLWKK